MRIVRTLANPVNVPHALPPMGCALDADRSAVSERVAEPPAADGHPVVADDHDAGFFSISPLTLPARERRRIVGEIVDEPHVVTEASEYVLQLIRIRAPDLSVIVAELLNYAVYLIDGNANDGGHCRWSAVRLPVLALHLPQRGMALTGSSALWCGGILHHRDSGGGFCRYL
jgi:hypothetical protein